MTPLVFIAFSCRLMAFTPPPDATDAAPASVLTTSSEVVADLPSTPGPQIDDLSLFPNQAEIRGGAGLNDQRFGYVLHGEARASYESNIFIQAHHAQDDFIFRISPGLAVGVGEFRGELPGVNSFRHQFETYVGKNYLYADYSPSYTWFASHSDQDTLDQDVHVAGELNLRRFTFGLDARYLTQNVPEEDVGTRVKQRRMSAALTSVYEFSGRTSFEAGAYFDSIDYDGNFVDTREWRNEDWMNYQLSPKVKMGLGAVFGYLDESVGPSQTYEGALLRFKYEATDRLSVGMSGGFQDRHTAGTGDRGYGVFQVNLAWTPTDGAYVYLQGFRRAVSAGNYGDDYYYATGVQVQYRQRLLRSFFFQLTGGYQNGDYQTIPTSGDYNRTDNLYFVRPGVGFDFATWFNCEVDAEYRRNESTIDQRGFSSTTATVRFNLVF